MALAPIQPTILTPERFGEDFQQAVAYSESSPSLVPLAYGRPSSKSKRVIEHLKIKEELSQEKGKKKAEKLGGKAKANIVKIKKLEAKIEKLETIIAPERRAYISQVHDLYLNAAHANLPCIVIGDSDLRNRSVDLLNFGVLSYGESLCSKRILHLLPTFIRGSILNDGAWNILKNDAFILGAIHGHKTVYVSTEGHPSKDDFFQKVIWDEKASRAALTGREVAMLYAAGYRQVATEEQVKICGYTFVCLDKAKATSMRIMDLIEVANRVKDIEELIRMFTA